MSESIKEHPILFSAPMVNAILEGRKTQTRRVIKPQPTFEGARSYGDSWAWRDGTDWFSDVTTERLVGRHGLLYAGRCPFGGQDDRLWVREHLIRPDGDMWLYAADRQPVMVERKDQGSMIVWAHHKEKDYCTSMFMPRWASRITLKLTGVRVERLQDISETDAEAEGAPLCGPDAPWIHGGRYAYYRPAFFALWGSINGKNSGAAWADNPWVWVLEFIWIPQN